MLFPAGYQTAVVGKWHLQTEPTGFDYYCVLPGQGRYQNPVLKTKENWGHYLEGGKEYKGFSADVIADMCIDWIKDRDKDRPFLALCHFKATHEPFDYPERHKQLDRDLEIHVSETFWDTGPETNGRVFTGQSIDNLKGKTPGDWREYGYYRYWQHQPNRPGHFGIRGQRYKLAFYYGNGFEGMEVEDGNKPARFWEFFDLQEDPKEQRNAYDHPQYQDIIKEMKEELAGQRELLGDTDEDKLEILRIISAHWDKD